METRPLGGGGATPSRSLTVELIDRYLGIVGFATFVVPVLGGLYLATRFLSAGVTAQPWAILSTYSPQDLATYGVPMAIVPLYAFAKLGVPPQAKFIAPTKEADHGGGRLASVAAWFQHLWNAPFSDLRVQVLLLLLALGIMLFAPLYVAIVTLLQAISFALFRRYGRGLARQDLSLVQKKRRIAGAATAYFSVAVLVGVTFAGANSFSSSQVVFKPDAKGLKDGEYIVLNPGHNPAYLGLCRDDKIVATVQTALENIVVTTSRVHEGPGNNSRPLWDVLRGRAEYQLGATVRCDSSPETAH